MATVADPAGRADTPVGRMGHGLGLDLTEPPSLAPDDPTILEAGMVITLEPSLTLPGLAGMARRLMVHEENVVVTRGGVRAPHAPRAGRAAHRLTLARGPARRGPRDRATRPGPPWRQG